MFKGTAYRWLGSGPLYRGSVIGRQRGMHRPQDVVLAAIAAIFQLLCGRWPTLRCGQVCWSFLQRVGLILDFEMLGGRCYGLRGLFV